MSDAWIRVEDGKKKVEDPEMLGKWLSMAESEQVWVPSAHVEGHVGDLQVERSQFIEQLPVDNDSNDFHEAEL